MYNNYNKKNNQNNQNRYYPPRRNFHKDYTSSILSAINRARREIFLLSGSEQRKMITYVTTHNFYCNPSQAIHKIIDMQKTSWTYSPSEATRDIWNLLRKYTR